MYKSLKKINYTQVILEIYHVIIKNFITYNDVNNLHIPQASLRGSHPRQL